MYKKSTITVIFIISVIVLVISLFCINKSSDNEYDFKIYFFNAGKADAILISKNDKYIMIDTGEESLSSEILDYFYDNNITKLDYLIITHFDKDHVGSASGIIDNVEIGKVLQSNSSKDSEYYLSYLNSLSSKSIIPITVCGDYEFSIDDMDVVVNGSLVLYENSESNNSSLIVSIMYGDNKFLFMGDSENSRINDFLSGNLLSYDFMKIPYHGNYLKRLDDLLDEVMPRYGVMTCSFSDGCDTETLDVLDSHNVYYYMTKNGAISVLSNGYDIKISQ